MLNQRIGDQHKFGKSARKPFLDAGTGRVMPAFTIIALHTGRLGRNKHPVSRIIFIDRLPDPNNLSADLMPRHQRCPGQAVPFHDIAATNAAGHHLDQHLIRTGRRCWDFFDPDVLIIVPFGDFHLEFSLI
jgi:hypothetical protein